MIYPHDLVELFTQEGLVVRQLTAKDLPMLRAFRACGCEERHVRAIVIRFEGKGNGGLKPVGAFLGGKLVCPAMPMLDSVRELKKYDIGAIFAVGKGNTPKRLDSVCRYIIDTRMKDGAAIGNSNAIEENGPLGGAACERVGLTRIAQACEYSR